MRYLLLIFLTVLPVQASELVCRRAADLEEYSLERPTLGLALALSSQRCRVVPDGERVWTLELAAEARCIRPEGWTGCWWQKRL